MISIILTITVIIAVACAMFSLWQLLRIVKVRRLTDRELRKPGCPENPDKKSIYVAAVPQEAAFVRAFGSDYVEPKVICEDTLAEDLAKLTPDELLWVEEQAGTDERIKKLLDSYKKNEEKP